MFRDGVSRFCQIWESAQLVLGSRSDRTVCSLSAVPQSDGSYFMALMGFVGLRPGYFIALGGQQAKGSMAAASVGLHIKISSTYWIKLLSSSSKSPKSLVGACPSMWGLSWKP